MFQFRSRSTRPDDKSASPSPVLNGSQSIFSAAQNGSANNHTEPACNDAVAHIQCKCKCSSAKKESAKDGARGKGAVRGGISSIFSMMKSNHWVDMENISTSETDSTFETSMNYLYFWDQNSSSET